MSTEQTTPPTDSIDEPELDLELEEVEAHTSEAKEYLKGKKSDGRVPVVEIFGPTIQGEGPLIGTRCHFIRLGGCDFRCTKCDSLHAVIPDAVKKNAAWCQPDEVLAALDELNLAYNLGDTIDWVIISGGNPAIWPLHPLIELLHRRGYKVQLETQGSVWQPWIRDCDAITVCPKGPGMGERFPKDQFLRFMGDTMWYKGRKDVAVKSVIFDQRDFEFTIELDHILTHEIGFPHDRRYLSLGNPYPPKLDPSSLWLEQSNTRVVQDHQGDPIHLSTALLHQYRLLLDDYLQDRRLRNWRFLPQLHVLIWGNESAR